MVQKTTRKVTRSASSGRELEKTTHIKAKLGTKFGVRYWLSRAGFIGEPTLHLIYHVPTMINPSTGEVIDKIEILQEESKVRLSTHHGISSSLSQYELSARGISFLCVF